MAFNLQEYILFRQEIKRELLNGEVDNNFKMVANPWVSTRVYDIGNIVYHPVTLVPATGEVTNTGDDNEELVWYRANKRTTRGVFDPSEWDLIGGVGTTDSIIEQIKAFGKVKVNSTDAATFNSGNDVILDAENASDTLKIVAGTGISLQHDASTNALRITNLGSSGTDNEGINLSSSVGHQDVYAGMVGDDLSFKGFQASNSGSTILSVSTVADDITYTLTEANIDLANINSGAATADMLSDIDYASGPNLNDILQWNGSNFVPVAASSLGTGEINTGSNLGSGQGVFASKVGVDLRFKGLAVNVPTGTAFSISATSDTIIHTFNEGAISLANLDGGSPTIGDLTDVALSSLSNGDLLVYNSTSGDFENSTVATAVGLAYNLTSTNIITPNNGGGNSNNSAFSSILAGDGNTISATTQESSVIVGGRDNTITNSDRAFIGNGFNNGISGGESSVIVAGEGNSISEIEAFIGGGSNNIVDSQGGVVVGGNNNEVQNDYSFIGSGTSNETSGAQSVVVGGNGNQATAIYSAILGGAINTAGNSYAAIAGGQTNEVSGAGGFIGAGTQNEVTSQYGVVSGGFSNSAITGAQATVGGGSSNIASGVNSTVAGGTQNTSSGQNGFIGGGILNNINSASLNSSIPGGSNNSTSTFDNVHILGSAITADAANTTYTQNLKASGSSIRLTGIPTASTSDILFYNSTTGAVSTASSTSVGSTILGSSAFYVNNTTSFPDTQANPQTYAIGNSFLTGLPTVKVASVWSSDQWGNPATVSIGTSTGSVGTITEEDLGANIPVPFDIPVGATLKLTLRVTIIRDSNPNTLTAEAAIMKLTAGDVFEVTNNDTEIEMLESVVSQAASKSAGNNFYWNFAVTHTVTEVIDENDSLFIGFAFDNFSNVANDNAQIGWSLAVIS